MICFIHGEEKIINKAQAHDILHSWYGGKSENCPNCNGSMSDSEMMSEAKKIATENYKPKANPMLPYDQRLQTYEEKKQDPKKPEDKKLSFELKPFVDLFSFAEKAAGSLPGLIKVIPIGEYNMQRYGKVKITKEKIADMVKHFNENVRAFTKQVGLPIDVEHGATQWKDAAAGWIKKLVLKDDGGYAEVEWTELGKKLLKEKIYKFYSPEFHFDYIDPQHSYELSNVMTGGGLVNKPMIKDDLNPLVYSENDLEKAIDEKVLTNPDAKVTLVLELQNSSEKTDLANMKLSEIIAKAKNERNSDEQKFLIEHQDELTFAEAKKEGLVPAAKSTQGIQLSEGQTIVEKEKLDSLIAMAERGQKAHEALTRKELIDQVKAATFSEDGVKVAADQVEKWADKMMAMSEADRKDVLEMLKSLPEKQVFGEKGNTREVAGSTTGNDLDKQIREIMLAEKVDYATAASRIMKDNPQQYSEYNSSLPVAQAER